MDDNLISQFLDTPADADYGESDLIKMRKVQTFDALRCIFIGWGEGSLVITQYKSQLLDDAVLDSIKSTAKHYSAIQAFVNEKTAPEILDYKGDLVARLQDQIQNQACSQAH